LTDTAIILAGGLGERLRPLTDETPKPLLPALGKPIVQHTIGYLKNHGVKNIILSIGYKADVIQEYFGDGSQLGVNISYCIEDEPLGTGGAVKKAAAGLTEPFILTWGDELKDIDYSGLRDAYLRNNCRITMVLTPRDDVQQFGVAKLEGEKIAYFVEKPKPEEAPSNLINAGAFIINPKCLEMLPEGKSSIERDCFEKLAPKGEISAFIHKSQWYPTDTLERYTDACRNFKPALDFGKKEVIIADVDETICESCQQVSEEMAAQIDRLITQGFKFAFISGTKTADLQKMISSRMKREHHLLGTTGTNYTVIRNGKEESIYNLAFSEQEKQEIIVAFEKLISEYNIQSMTTKEDQLQDRDSQITLSAIGRNAPSEMKAKYDPDGEKRKVWVEFLRKQLGDNYEFKIGGTTSVDITRKGLDKAWGIKKFAEHNGIPLGEILFFGDKIYPGGNDFAAAKVVDCIPVKCPDDTLNEFGKIEAVQRDGKQKESVVNGVVDNDNQHPAPINNKYYQDIKNFPSQFMQGIQLAQGINMIGYFNRVIICGVGGSSLYVEMINDFLDASDTGKIRLEANRSYSIPKNADDKTLFIVASHSGNTEETLSCLDEIEERGYKHVVFTSGGKLMERAKDKSAPLVVLPTGMQPRLSTGFFVGGLLKALNNCHVIDDYSGELISVAEGLDNSLDEVVAKSMAKELVDKIPLVYSTDNNSSIARVAKIKFNENAKIQSFWNFFPEVNHNEMVGFTKMVMNPYFLIFKSKFTHPRNYKRIEVFSKLMQEKGLPVKVIDMVGDTVFAEMINAYYFVDHLCYYLATEYGIDPEPVQMVEEFKAQILT